MNATTNSLVRVIATTTTGFVDSKVDTVVKWEGTDTDELSIQFPPSNVLFADPFDQKEIENGYIITRYSFERQLEDGSWKQIDDPGRRLIPMTDYERAVDADNRRDFLGDYTTDDDYDRCGGYGCDECEDPYRVDCTNCNDHGCAKCISGWCTNCDDNGCQQCDPEHVCVSCGTYNDQDVVRRLCYNCSHDFHYRECDECGNTLDLLKKGKLCDECVKPRCSDCEYYPAEGEDGLCSFCRSDREEDAKPHCVSCDQTEGLINETICPDCDKYWRCVNRWYRRLWFRFFQKLSQ